MDKLTKLVLEHGEIAESIALYEKSLPAFSSYTENFIQFLDEYIAKHFKFEEEEIFPLILKKGTPQEKAFIEEFEKEHRQVLDIVNQFYSLVSKYGTQPSGAPYNELRDLIKKIIQATLAHANREDLELFPLLKKYDIDLL